MAANFLSTNFQVVIFVIACHYKNNIYKKFYVVNHRIFLVLHGYYIGARGNIKYASSSISTQILFSIAIITCGHRL